MYHIQLTTVQVTHKVFTSEQQTVWIICMKCKLILFSSSLKTIPLISVRS